MSLMTSFQPRIPAPIDLGNGEFIGAPRIRTVTEDDVLHLLQTRDDFVAVAIVIMYSRQCIDERAGGVTRYNNAMGFNMCDARMGAYYGAWVTGESVRNKNDTPHFVLSGKRFYRLTGNHLRKARLMLHKYRKQLAQAINDM